MFESMAMEKPVILGLEGEAKALVKKAKCGICIRPENAKEIKKAVLKLYNNRGLCKRFGRNGRNFVKEHFSREMIIKKFERMLR